MLVYVSLVHVDLIRQVFIRLTQFVAG